MQFASLCIAVLGMASIVQAGPVGEAVSTSALAVNATMQKQPSMPLNPCDGVNAEPYLYHNYTEPDCPARFHARTDGTCELWYKWQFGDDGIQCATFCQQGESYAWSRLPFAN
ncbi:hypothetical protein DL546_002103 [Coniochaeta pulveracea]|uniref:BPTI/Kunitz inhibitor domain-containing protein n=1 Tax=Coniochaeta pulveracea TaxID=177199 RepID=A0A420Y0A7_9PEZI|nr:hypothetical protein DL546_002103 [Coniochaeta pulveracea]